MILMAVSGIDGDPEFFIDLRSLGSGEGFE
jgi:hypothetical protein